MTTNAIDLKEPMLQFFEYAHLPAHLQAVSQGFRTLAISIATDLPRNPERTVALRKLVEAKDCAVRAVIYKNPDPAGIIAPNGVPATPTTGKAPEGAPAGTTGG